MKKKGRILAFMLCFVFLFFVGCGMGEESFGDGENPISTRMLDGVKALSKPATYNFKEAVGTNASENYYNIFAYQILDQLYSVYENNSSIHEDQVFDFTEEELNDGLTYGQFVEDNENKKYYLYDSLRYTITQVTSVLDSSESVTSQVVTVDLTKGWNWTVPIDNVNKTFFDLIPAFASTKNSGLVLVTVENTTEWLDVMQNFNGDEFFPSFSQFYTVKDPKPLESDNSYADYYYSPTYNEGYSGEALVNYYQDALEYATYLFVLGFDYVDEAGNEIAGEKDYFDFIIDFSQADPVKVKAEAFGDVPVSITDALAEVKLWYKQMGNIVGLTAKNKAQLSRFVLDKVIGIGNQENQSPDQFTVEMFKKHEGETVLIRDSASDLKFNRNYKAVVDNIIDYACQQTRIGVVLDENGDVATDDDGNDIYLKLDQEYMASTITDYPGNNFFVNYKGTDGTGESDDGEMFHFIQPGEYQSFVLMPQQVDVNNQLPLTDIWLAFEYYNDDDDYDHDQWSSDPSKKYAEDITINVGFRFFDKTPEGGDLITFTEATITIPYGRYDSFVDINAGKYPDQNWLYISTSGMGRNKITIDKQIIFDKDDGLFNNNIGDGAINTGGLDENATIILSGSNRARDYYMSNPSRAYGSYGTLNPAMFMGEDGCDYMEVYFDIVKDKTHPEINYNFKVGLVNLFYFDKTNDRGPTN